MAVLAGSFSDAELRQLRELWADPANSTAAIGRAMGRSKHSVVGKAHRMGLPARPSPIAFRRDGAAKPQPPRAPRVTLPSVEAVIPAVVVPETRYTISGREVPLGHSADRRDPIRGATLATVQAAGPVAAATPSRRPRDPCCWPIGEPGTARFRYCEVPSEPRRPYCAAHSAIAFAKPSTSRGDVGRTPAAG